MPIVAGDIVFRYSVKTGSAGDSTASTGPNSLGKYVSTTVQGATLWDDVSAAENAASEDEYRCVFILNNHATLTLVSPVVYIAAQGAGGTDCTIAIDNIAVSAKGSASAQAAEIANENTAPTGVGAFSAPTSAGTGLALGADLGPGQVKGIWIKRTTTNSAATADSFQLGWAGETGP